MDTINILDKKWKQIFINIIQLGKGKWWLETILMFLDYLGSNFSILTFDFLSIWPPALYTQVEGLDPSLYIIAFIDWVPQNTNIYLTMSSSE